jgi:hypothetical protein
MPTSAKTTRTQARKILGWAQDMGWTLVSRVESERDCDSDQCYYFEYHYENLRKLGHGANRKNMNAALIRGFPLAFPRRDERRRHLATALSSVDSKLAHHGRKHATLTALFRTLLHQLMTAQIRVNDLELPAACALDPH